MQLQSPKEKLQEYLQNDSQFYNVHQYTQEAFLKANLPGHNWEHVYRDTINAIIIGEAEKADMEIVLPAITMHDIGFLYEATGKTHAMVGADKLLEYLEKITVAYSTDTIQQIRACIRTHKGSMHNEKPQTLEAKVVADADMLEKFGPIGIYQAIKVYTEFRIPTEEAIQRIYTIVGLPLETKTGEQLVKEGREFVRSFAIEFEKAYDVYNH